MERTGVAGRRAEPGGASTAEHSQVVTIVVAATTGAAAPTSPSSAAVADTPADLLRVYQSAAQSCGMPWQVLAATGEVESDHGRSTTAGVPSGSVNPDRSVFLEKGHVRFEGSMATLLERDDLARAVFLGEEGG